MKLATTDRVEVQDYYYYYLMYILWMSHAFQGLAPHHFVLWAGT